MARPFPLDPIPISYSGWQRYTKCPQQHFLVMTGQRPSIVDGRNFLNGNVLHKVLERWFTNEFGPEWIAEQAAIVWDEYVDKKYILFKSPNDRAGLRAKCILWGTALTKQVVELGIDKSRCQTELSIERFISVDGYQVKLNGYIDVLAETSTGDHVVLDLKCSASRSVMNPYQMVFYSLLLQDEVRQRDSAFILPALDDIVPYTVSEEHRQWLLGDIQQMARDIVAGKFEPDTESGACFFCDVKALCPAMGGDIPVGRGRQQL